MSPGLLLIIGLALLTTESSGLNCWVCTGENKGDLTCIDDWKHYPGVQQVDCHQGEDVCCTIRREVYTEHTNTITSFSRGCEENCKIKHPTFDKKPDSTHIYYVTKCNTPLCNINDGTKPLAAGGGGAGNDDNIINGIPGENSATHTASGHATASLLGITLITILDLYWRWWRAQ